MQYSFSRLLFVVCLGSVLAACGSSPKKEETTKAEPPPNQLPSGATAPVETGLEGSGSALGGSDGVLPTERVVYFDYDRSDVRMQDRALLEAHAAYLKANSDTVARLEGHADERGSREYNLALGESRAMAIARYLNILGVPERQMESFSYGEEKPVAIGHDEDSWQKNRRVEFIYPGSM